MTRKLPTTRYEHLFRAKARALQLVDEGKLQDAIEALLSDLGKWREPLYTADYLTVRTMEAQQLAAAGDADGMARWIETFR